MTPAWIDRMRRFIRARLEGRPLVQKLIGNTGWLFADRMVRLGAGLFVGVWVARYLGPERFGQFNYALAFVGLFGAFATLGLDAIVVRDLVNNPSASEVTLGTAFVLKLLTGLATTLVVVCGVLLLRPSDSELHLLVVIMALAMVWQAFDTIDFWFQSRMQALPVVVARTVAFLILTIIKVILIQRQAPLIAFVIAYTAEFAMAMAGLLVAYKAHGQRFMNWRFRSARARELLRDGWPLVLSGVAVMVYMRIDQIMLGQWLGDEAVGQYAAATRLAEVWFFIPMAIYASALPAIVEGKGRGEAEYQRRLQQLFDVMAVLALAITLPMLFLAGPIVQLIFGAEYAAAGPILAVQSLGLIFTFFGLAQSTWEVAEGLTKSGLWKRLAGAAVNIFLNLFLLPSLGGLGAAIATVISYGVAASLANLVSRQSWPVLQYQWRSLMLVKHLRALGQNE